MERELLLLGLLRRHSMHGYQLHEVIQRSLASCADLKKPTAYALLERMAQRGWLTAHEEPAPERGRPPRTRYTLTPDGEAAYHRLLRENLATYQPTTFPGETGLAFLDTLPPAEARALLQDRRALLADALAAASAAPPHEGALQIVVDHQRHHLRSELAWLDSLLARLPAQGDITS